MINGRQKSAVALAQQFIAVALSEDGLAIDATAGNGNDTVFLAKHLPNGVVYSFDIQKEALTRTALLVKKQNMTERVKLIHDGHQNIDCYLKGPVDAVMFNLGYLPKGDHTTITKPESTIAALDKAVKMLKTGGRISIIVYIGHQGGLEELAAVTDYLKELDSQVYLVTCLKFINKPPIAPLSYYVERVI